MSARDVGRLRLVEGGARERVEAAPSMNHRLVRMLGAVGIVAAIASAPAAAKADDACWKMVDGAIAHRAAAVVPAFVRYTVKRSIAHRGGLPLVTEQHVVFRTADGAAQVVDSLYGDAVRYTYQLEPGPPFVGPPVRDDAGDGGPAIATVHAHAGKACDDLGAETVAGVSTEHLRITPHKAGGPGIRDLWVAADGEIWRAVVAQFLDGASLAGLNGSILLACTIDVRAVGHQAVVSSVRFSDHDLALEGEYVFSGYTFSSEAPAGSFPP
jgi:hypothetical protein